MTKQEYEKLNHEDFLTKEEKERESKINTQNHYGMSDNQLLTLAKKHKIARKKEDYKTMAKIEYRLTQINFHWEVGKMYIGEYDAIFNSIGQTNLNK